MPFVQMRNHLAELWHCRPGDIDEIRDADEIGTFLEVKELEHRYRPHSRGDNGDAEEQGLIVVDR
jgi:Holliday junction resolvase-like predicted endonuclease